MKPTGACAGRLAARLTDVVGVGVIDGADVTGVGVVAPSVAGCGSIAVVTPPTAFESEIISCGKKLVDDALTIFVAAFATRAAAAFSPETAMLRMSDITFPLY